MNIRTLENGRRQIDFTLGGRRTRKCVDAHSDSEALMIGHRMLVATLDQHERQPIASIDMPIGEAVDLWERSVEPIASARSCVRHFASWFDRSRSVRAVSEELIAAYSLTRTRGDGGSRPLKATSLRAALSRLRAFLGWCFEKGLIAAIPRIRWPKGQSKPPALLTEDEVTTLLASVRGHHTFEPFYLLALCGLRRGECLAARWEHVDLDNLTIVVIGTKTVESAAIVPLFGPIVPYVKRVLAGLPSGTTALTGFIVGIPSSMARTGVTFRALWQRYNRKNSAAPLPNPHRCRHTIATALIVGGADLYTVQKLLRHASPVITARMYVHAGAVSLRHQISAALPKSLKDRSS